MATPAPITDWPWDTEYLILLSKFPQNSPERRFFEDLIATVNRLLVERNALEARIAVLEP